jgi:hypothetical protein
MASMLSFTAYADTDSISNQNTLPELWEYQEVIDNVNVELGSDFAFITAEESLLYEIPMPDPQQLGSLEVFEANIREQIATAQAWDAETAAATISVQSRASATVTSTAYPIFDENGKYIGATDDPAGFDIDRPLLVLPLNGNEPANWNTMRNYSEGVSSSISQSGTAQAAATTYYNVSAGKDFPSKGFATVSGQIYRASAWVWNGLPSTGWAPNSFTPLMTLSSTSKSLIDASRTCAITFYGTYYASASSGGVSSSQYAEFNAGTIASNSGLT